MDASITGNQCLTFQFVDFRRFELGVHRDNIPLGQLRGGQAAVRQQKCSAAYNTAKLNVSRHQRSRVKAAAYGGRNGSE